MTDRPSQGYNPTEKSGGGDKSSWEDKKGKALENIQNSTAKVKAGYNHMKFTLGGYSDQREFADTEEAQESAKKLSKMRKKYGVQESETQVIPSDSSYSPQNSYAKQIYYREVDPEAIRPLNQKEKKELYDLKHQIKLIIQLKPSQTGSQAESLYVFANRIIANASAYINSGVIDRNYSRFLYTLDVVHGQLVRYTKPGEALKELMRLPDDTTVPITKEAQNLLDSFRTNFSPADEIIPKLSGAIQHLNEAARDGIKLECAENSPDAGSSTSHTQSHAHMSGDTIYLPRDIDPIELTSFFLFELKNGLNRSRLAKISQDTAKTSLELANECMKLELEAAWTVGEIWSRTKTASKDPTKLDCYNRFFYLSLYQDKQKGTMSEDNILKKFIDNAMIMGGKTHMQHYQEHFDQVRNRATQP